MWILLGMLVLAELFVFAKIPGALLRGAVPLNPLGWFGYSEYLQVSVDRESAPLAYWLIVSLLAGMALIFGLFIYELAHLAAAGLALG
jgi:hypothetical protein